MDYLNFITIASNKVCCAHDFRLTLSLDETDRSGGQTSVNRNNQDSEDKPNQDSEKSLE